LEKKNDKAEAFMSGYSTQNQRQLRVGEQIRHILSAELRDCFMSDPALAGLNAVTISEVRISPDLKNASVYIVPPPGEQVVDMDAFMKALNRASSYFRKHLSREITLRYTPRLNFVADTSFFKAAHVYELLAGEKVRHDVAKHDEEETRTGT
jgi:ribosome-binding factor A